MEKIVGIVINQKQADPGKRLILRAWKRGTVSRSKDA